ncbi:Protein FAR1-RELATED SEQUENCE 5 [Bienertia sinuspersici]
MLWNSTHPMYFYEFQNELLAACFDCGLHNMIPEKDVQIVILIDHKRNSKMHTVRYHLDNNMVECTFKMYEREGIPYRHILWVIKEKGLKSLPEAYVKTRWSKAAMSMPMFDLGGNLIEDTTKMEAVKKKVGHLWSEIFTCVSMDENNEDCLHDFMKLIDGFKQSLLSRGNVQASANKGKQMETLLDCPLPEEITILDPNKSKNKGKNKRKSNNIKSLSDFADLSSNGNARKSQLPRQSGILISIIIVFENINYSVTFRKLQSKCTSIASRMFPQFENNGVNMIVKH